MRSIGKHETKSKQWVMMMSASEYAMLEQLATAKQVSGAEVMRQLLRQAYEKHAAKAGKR